MKFLTCLLILKAPYYSFSNDCVGTNSCGGTTACVGISDVCDIMTIGNNACNGAKSCLSVGQWGGSAHIGNDSCKGVSACLQAGSGGSVTVGANSCKGQNTCSSSGRGLGVANIGNGSCEGRFACDSIAYSYVESISSAVTIGDSSCIGEKACYQVGQVSDIEHNILIGSGACKCNKCCSCLSGNVAVSDGHCNSRGTGATHCCTAQGTMNDLYPGISDKSLPVYDIGSPTCSTSKIGTNAIVAVTCTYVVTIPDELDETSVRSEIYGSSGCNGDAPNSVTKGTPTLSINKDEYQITINITVSGENSVAFCLRTVVTDDEDNEMKYNSQVLEANYNYTADFNLTLAAKEFEGLNETTADLGAVEFEVEVFRCDSGKFEVQPSPLTINEDLYICIRRKTVNTIVLTIDEFTIEKDNVDNANKQSYKAVENGKSDYNTYVNGEGFDTVVVATRPQAFLFVDDADILIRGKATLGIEGNGRYLARFTEEIKNEGASNNFEMEVEVIKASSGVGIASTVGTIIGIVAGGTFIFL